MLYRYVVNAVVFLVMSASSLTSTENTRVSVGWLSSCYLLLSGAEVLLAAGALLLSQVRQLERLLQTPHNKRIE